MPGKAKPSNEELECGGKEVTLQVASQTNLTPGTTTMVTKKFVIKPALSQIQSSLYRAKDSCFPTTEADENVL